MECSRAGNASQAIRRPASHARCRHGRGAATIAPCVPVHSAATPLATLRSAALRRLHARARLPAPNTSPPSTEESREPDPALG